MSLFRNMTQPATPGAVGVRSDEDRIAPGSRTTARELREQHKLVREQNRLEKEREHAQRHWG